MVYDPRTGRHVNVPGPAPDQPLTPAADAEQVGQAFYDFSTFLGILAMLADLFKGNSR